jgi:hypothetical protein
MKVATDFLSVDALASCKVLAGEFRQLNLQDAWKDDVLQLNAQLYYAYMSLQRPLEDARAEFQVLRGSHNDALHLDPSQPTRTTEGARTRKRKHREDVTDEQNPNRRFKCLHCKNENRSFFKHGLQHHLCVIFILVSSFFYNSYNRKTKHMVNVDEEGFRIEQHLLS